jgi:hypothetical protein
MRGGVITIQSVLKYFVFLLIAFLAIACNENPNDMNDFYKVYGSDSAEIAEFLTEISKHKIIFGHQSVGQNILDGIALWEEGEKISLNRVTTRDFSQLGEGVFIDFRVGQNRDPFGKVDDFVLRIRNLAEGIPSIAFFKFCYVDVVSDTDVDSLFDYYKEKMLFLKNNKTNCRIILTTVPLTTLQKGFKATAKKILNMEPSGYVENMRRNEFNERIVNELAADFPVFDLAAVESTFPAGKINTYHYRGVDYPCLPDSYTLDGGHLNEYGSRLVAYNLLAFLFGELD